MKASNHHIGLGRGKFNNIYNSLNFARSLVIDAEERQSDRLQGDTPTQFLNASKVIEADYTVPFLAHTCMEPLNATAEISNGQCEIWVGCQNPLGFRKAVAEALSLDEEKVKLPEALSSVFLNISFKIPASSVAVVPDFM